MQSCIEKAEKNTFTERFDVIMNIKKQIKNLDVDKISAYYIPSPNEKDRIFAVSERKLNIMKNQKNTINKSSIHVTSTKPKFKVGKSLNLELVSTYNILNFY